MNHHKPDIIIIMNHHKSLQIIMNHHKSDINHHKSSSIIIHHQKSCINGPLSIAMLNHRGVTCCGSRVQDVRLARSSPSMVQLIRRKCAMAPKRDKGSGMSTATGCNFRRTKKHVSNRKTKLGFSVVTFAILVCPNISPWKPSGMQVWRCMTVRTNSCWHKELEKPTTDELCKPFRNPLIKFVSFTSRMLVSPNDVCFQCCDGWWEGNDLFLPGH